MDKVGYVNKCHVRVSLQPWQVVAAATVFCHAYVADNVFLFMVRSSPKTVFCLLTQNRDLCYKIEIYTTIYI